MKRALLYLVLTAGSITQAMEQNIKTITGDLFIIPKALVRVDAEPSPEWLAEARLCNITAIDDKKLSIQKGDYLVEVWATDRENAKKHRSINWAASGHPDLGKGYVFPYRLPVAALLGKNEGDLVIMCIQNPKKNMGVHAILSCVQNAHRYNATKTGAQDFQSLLERLLRSATTQEEMRLSLPDLEMLLASNAKKREAMFEIPEPSPQVIEKPKEQPGKMLSKRELFSLRTTMGDTRTPLLCAVVANQKNIVRCLLERNANPNESRDDGVTPFRAAIVQKNVAIMSILVEHSANINIDDLNETFDDNNDSATLLHYFADKSYDTAAKDIRLLLSWGARQDIPNRRGEFPIHIASKEGRIENVNAFLDFTSDGSKEVLAAKKDVQLTNAALRKDAYVEGEAPGWGLI